MGFEVARGLERVEGKSLEGGEIDLLWAARPDNRMVVVLGEAKDFDLALHRVGAETALQSKIAAAERQLDRKAAAVRGSWRPLLATLSGGRLRSHGESALLAKMLLTSAYLPPHLQQRYPALTLREVERFVGEIRRWPEGFPPRFLEHGVELLPA